MTVDEISGVVIGICAIPFLICFFFLSVPFILDFAEAIGGFLADTVFDPIHWAIHDFICHCVEAHHRREIHKKGGFRN